MKTPLGIGLLVSVLSVSASMAQERLTDARPADAGMSAEPLKEGLGLFEKAVARDEIRGAVLLVARRGKIVLHEAVGWRDKDKQLPMRKDTLFHVASNTKPVIAAAALMLVEDGKLDLDAEVRRYLPAFDNEKSRGVKVRHLLSHTSGFRIPGIFSAALIQKSPEHPEAPSLRTEVDRFGTIGPEKTPGTTYAYNNVNYNTLGALIELASGQPLERFLDSRIYRPLGMTHTAHRDQPERVQQRSCLYQKKGDTWKVTYRPGDPPRYPFVRASGGMITDAADYARFLQMFLNGGTYDGRRLLKPETVRLATEPHTRALYSRDERKKHASFYGFGWHVGADGVYSHGGSDGTFAWVDPRHELIGILFTQSPGGTIPHDEFIRLVNRSIITRPVGQRP